MSLTDFIQQDKGDYTLSQLAEKEWKNFALYTVEARAIPNMIDGMKPANRYYLYSSILNSANDFKKVESIAGVITDYGYNHGTGSAAGAGQLMAAEWNNNICLVEGRGSFGTRLIQVPAATRYTQTRLHKNFKKYIKDIELSPKHSDPEHEPPAFYIPIIPLVLANGIKGIATGFATNILPRDPVALIKACEEYIRTGKIKNKLPVKFPQFSGKTIYNADENRYYCYGTIERKSKTMFTITEVPYGYDRETYIGILDKLEENDVIVSYDDLCDKTGFKFDVKLKQQNMDWSDDQILKEFKLIKPFTENLTVIDQYGKLKEYADERDLITDFCDYKNTILQKRIDLNLNDLTEENRWFKVKKEFINSVLDNKIVFKGNKKQEVAEQILKETSALSVDVDRLLRMNIMSLTNELVLELEQEIKKNIEELKYWKSTTPKDQFLKDLNEII